MLQTYNINQVNLLVVQLKLKDTLKPGDNIFIDKEYLNNIQSTLHSNHIDFEAVTLDNGGFEIKIKRNSV